MIRNLFLAILTILAVSAAFTVFSTDAVASNIPGGFGAPGTCGPGPICHVGNEHGTWTQGDTNTTSGSGGVCDGETLGGVICNVIEGSSDLPQFFAAMSYLAGIMLGFWGVIKLKDSVVKPDQVSIMEPSKRFLAGGLFLVLPYALTVAANTVASDGDGTENTGFNIDGAASDGLDGMLVRLVVDIFEPMGWLISAFCYIAGILLVMVGINRLMKTEQDGPRGPVGVGTFMTFLTGGALLSIDAILGAATGTLFETNQVLTMAELQYTDGMDDSMIDRAHSVISAALAFLMIVGLISFVRGFFVLRSVAEGDNQASMMAAITHIAGGALLVNLGPLMNAVQMTLGIDTYGILFT